MARGGGGRDTRSSGYPVTLASLQRRHRGSNDAEACPLGPRDPERSGRRTTSAPAPRGATSLSAVRVELLGPVRVEVDGATRTPTGKRDRALVALLALTPGKTVAPETVAAGLWGGLVPPAGALEALVDRVREETTGAALTSGPQGLSLGVDAADVDALEFERLAAAAKGQERELALATLDQALALWRGPALAGVEDVPFARP